MKQITLLDVAEIGYNCGLETLGESLSNIYSHYDAFFTISNMAEQETILNNEIQECANKYNLTFAKLLDMTIIKFVDKEGYIFISDKYGFELIKKE